MKQIKSAGFERISQNFGERRYEGVLSLKIFVPRSDNEENDRNKALEILLSASEVIRQSGINADVSYNGLDEIM